MTRDDDNIHFLHPEGAKRRQYNRHLYEKSVLSKRNSFPRRVDCRINLDADRIRSFGYYGNMIYLNRFYFKGTGYTVKALSQVVDRSYNVVNVWKHRGAIPDPIFKSLIKIPAFGDTWLETYLFEEVLIICKHLDELFKLTTNVRTDHPEITLMGHELELYRSEIKRSLIDGNSECWS